MQVDVMTAVPAARLDELWDLYHETFAPLAVLAVQRHLMHRAEFDDLMADERVTKYVAAEGDTVVGLATMTPHLDAVPLISPQYFAHHFPAEYERGQIFYCVFIGVRGGGAGQGVFVALQERMYDDVRPAGGRVVLDISTFNETERKLPWVVENILGGIAGTCVATRLDSQSFWMYEFPAAS